MMFVALFNLDFDMKSDVQPVRVDYCAGYPSR